MARPRKTPQLSPRQRLVEAQRVASAAEIEVLAEALNKRIEPLPDEGIATYGERVIDELRAQMDACREAIAAIEMHLLSETNLQQAAE